MIVLDASVLIAYLDPHHAHHGAAVHLLEDTVPPLIVHPITAAEVLVAPTRSGLTDQVWADLVAIGVELDAAPIDPRALARLRSSTGYKMPDCCVIASARAHARASSPSTTAFGATRTHRSADELDPQTVLVPVRVERHPRDRMARRPAGRPQQTCRLQ